MLVSFLGAASLVLWHRVGHIWMAPHAYSISFVSHQWRIGKTLPVIRSLSHTLWFRWLVRSSYGINGDPCNDCYTATFCPCCTANQLYQTTKRYGSSTSDGGALFNTGSWTHSYGTGSFRDCLYSFFCMPCAIGHMMEQTMDMPWAMGCCCVNLCVARNLIRYQHRIRGNDLVEECAIPYGLKCLGDITQSVFPFVWCVLWGVFVAASMQQLQEVQSRSAPPSEGTPGSSSTPSGGRYLFRNPSSVQAGGAHAIPVYPSHNGVVQAYPSAPHSTGGAPGGVELIQPVAVSISAPFHHTPSGYSRVNSPPADGNCHNGGGITFSIGQPLSEKEV
jgi:Cys-rich protein (TIGR01571 family)